MFRMCQGPALRPGPPPPKPSSNFLLACSDSPEFFFRELHSILQVTMEHIHAASLPGTKQTFSHLQAIATAGPAAPES